MWGAWHRIFPSKPKPDAEKRTGFADTYHGKALPLGVAKQLVSVKQDLTISYPEQVIPYTLARDLILHDPDHIIALDCPCRASRENPCQPVDVCLIVGEPFASMVSEKHPHRSKWITSERAREILEEEEQRGHVHHAFFKDAMLGRFYAICNCCGCCCGAMKAQRNGTPMLASSGYLSRVDAEKCQACGTCAEFCQFDAISIQNDHSVVDEEKVHGLRRVRQPLPQRRYAFGTCTLEGGTHDTPGGNALDLIRFYRIIISVWISNTPSHWMIWWR